jgi:YesN/AraC family two-component response regulator
MYRLLIVDDEPKIRKGLHTGYPWEELGFKVAGEAANGSEALDFIAVHPIEVVLSDIRMPVISGIDLVMRLNEQKSPVKVVLLSGYREFEYAQKAIQCGVCSYLVKPTGYDDVMSTFGRLRDMLDREHKDTHDTIDEDQPESGFYDKIINAVYSYVDNNISNASLEGAACAVNRSIYYLSRLFKQRTGQNFSDYVMSKKMGRAAALLSNYRYEIYEVSNLLGYDSAKNFSRAFKLYYGKCPRDYRSNVQGGAEDSV